jgi:alpha-N-arabinofuranosidase
MTIKRSILCIIATLLLLSGAVTAQQSNRIIIHADRGKTTISKYIYGQFAEDLGHGIYGGIWVGKHSAIPNIDGIRKDVVKALRQLNIPDVRWPGGCFADEYHWRNGIGSESDRPKTINTNWGMVTDTNRFGTHEFMELIHLIGAEPYIAGNVGSGTVEEMAQWDEYMTFEGDSALASLRRKNGQDKPWKVPFWGIGNESWGCGGQMTPAFYADQYRRYGNFLHDYSGNRLFKIASGAHDDDYHWTRVLMQRIGDRMDGLSLHYYTIAGSGWKHKGPSTNFSEDQYFSGLKKAERMDTLITRHAAIMDKYDPKKKIALVVDEWGIWTNPLPSTNLAFLRQQNSLRDALIASTTLDIFNKHADRVRMANIAQMVNVLQSMILTKGPQMIVTPTYYAFKLYKVHQGATLLPTDMNVARYRHAGQSIPSISATASKDKTGTIHLTISNLIPSHGQTVTCQIRGQKLDSIDSAKVLTAPAVDSINTFDHPNAVRPIAFHGAKLQGNRLILHLPSKSLVALAIQ